ncbi:MAG: M15 family metallopeptidase [Aquincola sp.]|nr:M15 family metallopeptidase [Aquincola sp.]MDH4288697.1 M15 family metallopeptidase [Aquincola sp.]MDH5328558.1 M15 family metallopeptidase [Aquincola sp.]
MNARATIRIEDIAGHPAFTRLDAITGIVFDLRYAGTNNFDGREFYRGIDCAWLRVEAARGLERAAAWLAAHHGGHRLLVLDALRPQRVQEAIWADVAGTPSQIYFAEPARGSIHSFGMAVDVTVLDARGRELEMGSGFDEMSLKSHPVLEAAQLAAGAITREHIAAREMLRGAMAAGGFDGIPTEWWHFNLGDPATIRREFPRVL